MTTILIIHTIAVDTKNNMHDAHHDGGWVLGKISCENRFT